MTGILAIDQGTTGSTCLVLDEHCNVIGRAYSEFTQHYPRPGWVEHHAGEIWDVTRRVAREAMAGARSDHPGLEIAGVGITNQRETVVLWDRETGEPVHRAIVWQDRRTAERCRELKQQGREDWVRERTGLVLDPYFSATKVEWLLKSDDGIRRRAEAGELALGTIDSWLVWKLTGGAAHVTDPTNASRTMLYNIDTLDWDDELLELFGVPRALLPEVKHSAEVYGTTTAEALAASVPVAGIAGDQQAALFGQGCVTAGLAKNTYGTGSFLLLNTGTERVESASGLLTTVACGPKGEPAYALEGSVFIAGAAVQWLRDGLRIIDTAQETDALARSLEDNEGVYFVPAFVGLGAPHWNAEARGTIVGLTRGSGRAHMVRAALESMAYSTHDVLRAMEKDSGITAVELGVDGGASLNDWLMQFQADIIGLPVRRPAMVETTALGAAGLAGIGTGVWRDAEHFLGEREAETRFEPEGDEKDRAALLDGWHRAIHATLSWADR
ncbi:MAG TPA: glycerol kinase GlpK [Longimicrobiales bacterium]|nr:glycerol kinase GlpK [Longimicrobiales bacterium]